MGDEEVQDIGPGYMLESVVDLNAYAKSFTAYNHTIPASAMNITEMTVEWSGSDIPVHTAESNQKYWESVLTARQWLLNALADDAQHSFNELGATAHKLVSHVAFREALTQLVNEGVVGRNTAWTCVWRIPK